MGLIQDAKTMADLIGQLASLKTESERLTAIIDIQRQLNAMTSDMSTLLQEKEDLARGKREAESREAELQKKFHDFSGYLPARLPGGSLVYEHQGSAERGIPAHYACTHCWNSSQQKEFLQPIPGAKEDRLLQCPACNAQYQALRPDW